MLLMWLLWPARQLGVGLARPSEAGGVQPLALGRLCARCGRCETYCEMIEARNPGRFHTTLASRGG